MYDLDKKLLDLNNQILSYRLAMNRSTAIDPFTNPIAPPIVPTHTPTPVEPAPVSTEDRKIESVQETGQTEKGPRGKRGKRGPRGEQGPAGLDGRDGKDFDPLTFALSAKIITTTYNASNEDCFLLIRSSENVDVILPDNVKDGKVIVVKNGSDEISTTVKTDSGAMIDGEFSFVLSEPYESLTLICNGGDWFVIENYVRSF